MKTKELKDLAKKNKYEFKCDETSIRLEKATTEFKNIIEISKICINRIWVNNCGYTDDADMSMLEGTIAYAKTPLEDREEEKRFYLRHKWIHEDEAKGGYLNKGYTSKAKIENSAIYFISTKEGSVFIQTQFTQVEIDEIKRRFNTNLEDFEQIEVEDETN